MNYEINRGYSDSEFKKAGGYSIKMGTPDWQVASSYRQIGRAAIAYADAAWRERSGFGKTIFLSMLPVGSLEEANIAIAIQTDMLERYAHEHTTTAEQILINNGTSVSNSQMYLEYGRAMRKRFVDEASQSTLTPA